MMGIAEEHKFSMSVLEVLIFMINDEFEGIQQKSIENQKMVLKFAANVWLSIYELQT